MAQKRRKITVNDYFWYLCNLSDEDRKKHNEETVRRGNIVLNEHRNRVLANVEKYKKNLPLDGKGGWICVPVGDELHFEVLYHLENQPLTFRFEIEDYANDLTINVYLNDKLMIVRKAVDVLEISKKVAAKRFADYFMTNLLMSIEFLFDAAYLYSTETVEITNPHSFRKSLIKKIINFYEEISGKPQGRHPGTYKNKLEYIDEGNKLAKEIINSIRELYNNGMDKEQIGLYDVAEHLNRLSGKPNATKKQACQSFRNELNRCGLKFLELKKQAFITK